MRNKYVLTGIEVLSTDEVRNIISYDGITKTVRNFNSYKKEPKEEDRCKRWERLHYRYLDDSMGGKIAFVYNCMIVWEEK